MQFASQTMNELQNAARFGCHDRLHHQLATAVEDSNNHRFLVHVHADILEVATHVVASLGREIIRSTESFPQGTVSFFVAFSTFFLPSCCPPLDTTRPLSHNALTPGPTTLLLLPQLVVASLIECPETKESLTGSGLHTKVLHDLHQILMI